MSSYKSIFHLKEWEGDVEQPSKVRRRDLSSSILPTTMENFLRVVSMFFIYITSGTSLLCEKCENYHGKTCKNTTTEICAPSVTSCRTTVMFERIDNEKYYQIWKSCANSPSLCNLTFNMTVGIDVYSSTKCCKGNLCNAGSISLVPTNYKQKRNGVECPYCYTRGKSCTPSDTMKCRGPQTRCFSFTGKIYNSTHAEDWAYQGCATKNICTHPIPPFPETVFLDGHKITCTRNEDDDDDDKNDEDEEEEHKYD
ncbi:phospholipase A2 inhibitor PIP-like [Anomaloglossus baeobatrachus]|uniref:phospholipase A2 inhibitor PIP-like n=1 Tax=Anomaloglossus baeobatrachus TaxID=238106 RepID=UPI003F508C7C